METEFNPVYDNTTQVEDYILNLLDKDNLTDQWFLIRTPYPALTVISIYLLFVLKIGPHFMENRRPYDLGTIMRIYNICQILGNARLLYYPFVAYINYLPYVMKLSCNLPLETDENVDELRLDFLYLLHGYMVLKILDLLDTVFMVLRKKNSQITVLHVYHHGVMVFGSWFTIKYLKSLQSVIPGMINVIVHVIMYSYFFLATFGEPVKKYLWWKKYLTKLQLTQFVIILFYISTLYYNGCPISKKFTYFWLFNVFVFLCLFVNFYVRAYVMKPETKEPKKKKQKES